MNKIIIVILSKFLSAVIHSIIPIGIRKKPIMNRSYNELKMLENPTISDRIRHGSLKFITPYPNWLDLVFVVFFVSLGPSIGLPWTSED